MPQILRSAATIALCLSAACSTGATAAPREIQFTLVSGAEAGADGYAYFDAGHGHHALFGRGDEIDGKANPRLRVKRGDSVSITLIDLDQRGQPAQMAIPALGLRTAVLRAAGTSATIRFRAGRAGSYPYNGGVEFDGRPQHVHAVGTIIVEP